MTGRFDTSLKRYLGQIAGLISMLGLCTGAAFAQRNKPLAAPKEAHTSVAGTVWTPDGHPVNGASVYWLEVSAGGNVDRRVTTKTNAQGQFRFPRRRRSGDEGSYSLVLVQATGWGLTFKDLPAKPGVSAALSITLTPPTILRLPFTDQKGKPLPNLPIRVHSLYEENMGFLEIPASMHGPWEQKTDAHGECIFPGLPQGVRVQFDVGSDKYVAPDSVNLSQATAQQVPPIALLPGSTVQGRVTSAIDGVSLSGIQVVAQTISGEREDGWGSTRTDAQGRYRMVGLRPGTYNLALLLQGERAETFAAAAREKTVVKRGVMLDHQDFLLRKGALITGKVTDKNTGAPITGMIIGVYGPARPRSGAMVQPAYTDAKGIYRVRVPAGAQFVYIMGSPSPTSPQYETAGTEANVAVREGAALHHDFMLTPGRKTTPVHGIVVGPDDAPIPHARVNAMFVRENGVSYGADPVLETDANGAFVVEGVTGSIRLRARSGALATDTTTLAHGGESVTLHLKPNVLITLSGMVVDEQGKPIFGAGVVLGAWWRDSDDGGRVVTTTDPQGRFAIHDLYPDTRYSVSGVAKGFGSLRFPPVQYQPGDKAEVPAIRLPHADRVVVGRVVDENGVPLAKQGVWLQGTSSRFAETVTDAQGRFRFESMVYEPLNLSLLDHRGVIVQQQRVAGTDTEVLLVRKSPPRK